MTDPTLTEQNPEGFNPAIEVICEKRCADVGDPACWRLPELVEPCEKITPCAECLAARIEALEALTGELAAALEVTRAIVVDGAITEFVYHDGDWVDRLYVNNGKISAALAKHKEVMG